MVKRILVIAGIVILVFVLVSAVLGYFMVYRPAMVVKADAERIRVKAAEMKEVFKKNDIDLIQGKLKEIRVEFDQLEKDSEPFKKFMFIPYVQDYFAALRAADHLLIAGEDTIVAVEPFADLIGFKKGKSNFFDKSAEERLQTAVLTLDKLMTKIGPISDNVAAAKKEIDTIDPNRYPEEFRGMKIRENIVLAKDQFNGVENLLVNAQPFLRRLPTIFGKDEEQKYLVIFQNDKERRATGGFWTGTTEIAVDKGKLTFGKVTNIYDIDDKVKPLPAPEKVLQYHKGVTKLYLRDANLSPDLKESIKTFETIYKTFGDRAEYDGIIFIDTRILVDLLKIFGDTQAEGVNFSAKEDSRCGGCPQAIYELSDRIGRPVGYVKTERKALLGSLLRELVFKAIGFSPSRYWGTLSQMIIQDLDEKHILLYFKDPKTQEAVEKMNWAGTMQKNEGGDYLSIVNVNFGGQKSNLFVKENVESKTTGNKRTVTMDFKNPFPMSDCNLESGGLCLNAPLRNWIRFYVPKGSKLTEFKGSRTKTETYDELGYTVFEGFLIVEPMGKAQVSIEYELPSDLNSKNLYIQKQSGVDDQYWKVYIDGVKKYDAPLVKDVHIQ